MNEQLYLFANKSTYDVCIYIQISTNIIARYIKYKKKISNDVE